MKKKLYIGLVLFTVLSWGGINYFNYNINAIQQRHLVTENEHFIDQAVDDISRQQLNISETKTLISLPHKSKSLPSDIVTLMPPTAYEYPSSSQESPLQLEINELQQEKMEYLTEKKALSTTIYKQMGIFKGWDVKNPFVNVVILPLLLYLGKKILDLLFMKFSKEIFDEA